ncbi:MAG: hypothetical protein F6K28_33175, partial [Microcoleus sp. SIO2G3]|nr:hypothetical protein [Microcoleus sp. SIO2G3]
HPFNLELSELKTIDLEFEESLTLEEAAQVSGALRPTYERVRRLRPRPRPYPKPLPPKPIEPPIYTTLALGEEGGWHPPDVTTRALGEEGGCLDPLL